MGISIFLKIGKVKLHETSHTVSIVNMLAFQIIIFELINLLLFFIYIFIKI